MLEEAGVEPVSYRTLTRRLPRYGNRMWRKDISAACAAHAALGPASLVLDDVSTLYFETDVGDGFREPGFSKERRLEPQITIGLLTDSSGFLLAVEAFEGNKAETATMVPTLQAFMAAHQLVDITVVADAGMLSDNNKRAPGGFASATVEWLNLNPVTTGDCTFSAAVAATPANTTHTVHLPVSVSICQLQVHPTVAGTSGQETPSQVPAGSGGLAATRTASTAHRQQLLVGLGVTLLVVGGLGIAQLRRGRTA